jgi:hypothetical protein
VIRKNINSNRERKTVLLLTYYFDPCTYVAANRPNSFAKELKNNGFNVEVVTRHWTGKEQVWGDYLERISNDLQIEESENFRVHRLPYIPTTYFRNKLLSKCQALFRIATGKINHDVNYYQYKKYTSNILAKIKVDFILVSIPPINALRVAAELSKKYKVKLFVDVRDYENKIVLNKYLKIRFFDMLRHKLTLMHSIKWFNQASLIFTVTPPITNFIKKITHKPVLTVMNGYQEKLLKVNESEYSDFYITLVGSVYEIPEFAELLKGFKLLFSKEFSQELKVQFIGSSTSESVVQKLKDAIPARNLILKNRLPQDVAMTEAARSQLLLVLGFKNMKGVLGTKPFEYMGLRKTIIQMPGDEDLMQKIILECNAGHCPVSAEQFVNIIENCFVEWRNKGSLKYNGNIELIGKYSREEQFKQLLDYFV